MNIGPGSGFVNAAKQYVNTLIDIGIPAGPSESLIIADGTTSAELAAYDLCIEAEHGADSMALLITHKKDYAEQVAKHLNKIIAIAQIFYYNEGRPYHHFFSHPP
jgi:histidinol dehydrogenase